MAMEDKSDGFTIAHCRVCSFTSGWLFFPPLLRSGMFVRLSNEALLFIDYVKGYVFYFSVMIRGLSNHITL